MGATRQEEDSSGGRDRIFIGRQRILLCCLLFLFSSAFAGESGWLYICSSKGCFYKPFVRISGDRLVYFVSSDGRVYKGRCRKRAKYPCRATTHKRFYTSAYDLTYVIFSKDSPPRLLDHGEVDPLKVKKIYRGR